jgi:hypothetical protein
LVTCIPRGNIDLDQLETAATATLALYDKLVRNVNRWLDRLDVATLSPADGFTAFRLLGPALESLAIVHAKIGEQRGTEARNVIPQAPPPKIEETLELLRRRFDDNIKPKAN